MEHLLTELETRNSELIARIMNFSEDTDPRENPDLARLYGQSDEVCRTMVLIRIALRKEP